MWMLSSKGPHDFAGPDLLLRDLCVGYFEVHFAGFQKTFQDHWDIQLFQKADPPVHAPKINRIDYVALK